MSLKKLFGQRLQQIRKSKGLSQQEFAELVGLQTNSIGQIETGRRAVSFETIEKIAGNLEIDYYKLFDFVEINSNDTLINSAVRLMQKLDNNTLRLINLTLENYLKLKE